MKLHRVERLCGHHDNVPYHDMERAALSDCIGCYKSRKLAEARSQSEGMPDLEGSRAQVEWAMSIRIALMDKIHNHTVGSRNPRVNEAVEWWASQTKASLWIDKRREHASCLIDMAMREMKGKVA